MEFRIAPAKMNRLNVAAISDYATRCAVLNLLIFHTTFKSVIKRLRNSTITAENGGLVFCLRWPSQRLELDEQLSSIKTEIVMKGDATIPQLLVTHFPNDRHLLQKNLWH